MTVFLLSFNTRVKCIALSLHHFNTLQITLQNIYIYMKILDDPDDRKIVINMSTYYSFLNLVHKDWHFCTASMPWYNHSRLNTETHRCSMAGSWWLKCSKAWKCFQKTVDDSTIYRCHNLIINDWSMEETVIYEFEKYWIHSPSIYTRCIVPGDECANEAQLWKDHFHEQQIFAK